MATIKFEIDTGADGHKSSRAVHPFAGSRNKIAIVSSVKFTQTMKKAFDEGVNDQHVLTKVEDGKGYKKGTTTALEEAIGRLAHTANLIVTAGGSIAYLAASNVLTDPANTHFLSLLGEVPEDPPDTFSGGVSLENYAAHADRANTLVARIGGGATLANVGLLQNKNSNVLDNEAFAWNSATGNLNIFFAGTDGSGNNVDSGYAADFANVSGAIKGLVVSADPHFHNTKDRLLAAAHNWLGADSTRYICYCSLGLKADVAGLSTKNRTLLYGPDIEQAYLLLGQLAVTALKNETEMPVLKLRSTLVQFS